MVTKYWQKRSKPVLGQQPRFWQIMARAALTIAPPLSRFPKRITAQKAGTDKVINIKRHGVQPIVDCARILALKSGYIESSNTYERLVYLGTTFPKLESSLRVAADAYHYLNDIRFGHHLSAISTQRTPDNLLPINKLPATQREMLIASIKAVEAMQSDLAWQFGLQ